MKIKILIVVALLAIITSAMAKPKVGPPFNPRRDHPCHNVPESGSTLPLLGAGVLGLFLVRRKFQVVG
jgi:hypothetical protein